MNFSKNIITQAKKNEKYKNGFLRKSLKKTLLELVQRLEKLHKLNL